MVKMRLRRYPNTYDVLSLTDLESAASDAVSELDRTKANTYRIRNFSGDTFTIAPWDYVRFTKTGTLVMPTASASNAGARIAVEVAAGATATLSVSVGKINGAGTYSLATANVLREFVSNGIGWVAHA